MKISFTCLLLLLSLLLPLASAQWSDGDEWEWQSRKAAFWVLFGIACACLAVIVIVWIVWCCCPMKKDIQNTAPDPSTASVRAQEQQWSTPNAYQGILANYFANNRR